MTFERLLIVSAVLLAIGLYGVLTRRNAIAILMSLELMFNAVNIALVAISRYVLPFTLRSGSDTSSEIVIQTILTGQVFAIFVVTVAAAEIALGLGIVISIYRNRETIDVTDLSLMRR